MFIMKSQNKYTFLMNRCFFIITKCTGQHLASSKTLPLQGRESKGNKAGLRVNYEKSPQKFPLKHTTINVGALLEAGFLISQHWILNPGLQTC